MLILPGSQYPYRHSEEVDKGSWERVVDVFGYGTALAIIVPGVRWKEAEFSYHHHCLAMERSIVLLQGRMIAVVV